MSIFSVKFALWKDQYHTLSHYYKSPRFALIDLSFGLIALFSNPYRTCRKFLQKKGEKEVYTYGETPLTTYQKLAVEAGLCSTDTWLDLGSGRGKGCFWIAHFIQCRVIGIDWVPQFISRANQLKRLFRLDRLSFFEQNMEEVDFTQVTAIYLYGTWLPILNEKLSQLPSGAKVITISYSLDSPYLKIKKTFPVAYPWGTATAFLQEKE